MTQAAWHSHAVTFDMPREAFRDAFMIEWADDSQGAAPPWHGGAVQRALQSDARRSLADTLVQNMWETAANENRICN
jgi:hypothetical protein